MVATVNLIIGQLVGILDLLFRRRWNDLELPLLGFAQKLLGRDLERSRGLVLDLGHLRDPGCSAFADRNTV